MIEVVEFPLNARRFGSTVTFNTFVAESPFNGNSARTPYRDQSRRRWNAVAGVKRLSDLQILLTFFMAMRGRFVGVLVKDWIDYKATSAETTLTTIGGVAIKQQGRTVPAAGGLHQLVKRYTVGGQTHDRVIKRPDAAGLTLSAGAVSDITKGLVTASCTWTGTFKCEARFMSDELPAELFQYLNASNDAAAKNLADIVDVPLIELIGEELN